MASPRLNSSESLYRHVVFYSRWSVWITCVGVLLLYVFMFATMGTLNAEVARLEISSQTQLVGMLLLIALLPVWLLGCFFVTQRHTLRLAHQLQEQLGVDHAFVAAVARLPTGRAISGTLGGIVYAVAFNIPQSHVNEMLAGNLPALSLFLGQTLLWACVGFLLAIRLYIVNLFYQLGKSVRFSIFEQAPLEPFARVGMLDVVIVVGSLAIATVQSIDAQFRLGNYLTALLVAIPAGAVLLVSPMWTLHRRLVERKRTLFQEVRQQLALASEDSALCDIEKMESLLTRRDRVTALHTWPLDVAIWSRLLVYVLLPPLAWMGAAVVEVIVERLLGI